MHSCYWPLNDISKPFVHSCYWPLNDISKPFVHYWPLNDISKPFVHSCCWPLNNISKPFVHYWPLNDISKPFVHSCYWPLNNISKPFVLSCYWPLNNISKPFVHSCYWPFWCAALLPSDCFLIMFVFVQVASWRKSLRAAGAMPMWTTVMCGSCTRGAPCSWSALLLGPRWEWAPMPRQRYGTLWLPCGALIRLLD